MYIKAKADFYAQVHVVFDHRYLPSILQQFFFCFFSTEIYKIVSQKIIRDGGNGEDSPSSDVKPITIPPTTDTEPRKKNCCQSI